MRRKFLLKVMILSLLFVAMGGGYLYSQDGVTIVTTETDLATALAAGGKVELGNDIVVTNTIEILSGTKVTLDLNGKTISSGKIYPINNNGDLTINDSGGNGVIKGLGIRNGYPANTKANYGAKLTINGGSYENIYPDEGAALHNEGRAYINAGIFHGQNYAIYNAANLEINGSSDNYIIIEGYNAAIVYATFVEISNAEVRGPLKKENGGDYEANNVTFYQARIGEPANYTSYKTLAEALTAAQADDEVYVFAGTYAVPSVKAGITINGEVDENGKTKVLLNGTLSGTLKDLTLKNLHIKGGDAQRWAYAKGDYLNFENVTFEATSVYAIHFDDIAESTNLLYKDCTIIGWAAMGGSPESCKFENCTIKDNGTYGVIRTYFDATIEGCTFDIRNANPDDVYQDGIHAVSGAEVVVTGCTNVNGDMKDIVNVSGSSTVNVDGVVIQNPAKVGNNYYATIQDAIVAAAPSGTVELLADVTVDKWIMFSERLSIGNGNIINTQIDGLTIKGNAKKVTIKSIESAGNGNRLFYDATNLNIQDLTIECVDAAASQGGIGLTSGTISNVNFIGGGPAILPGTGEITVTGCTFKTNGTSIYYEEARDNLVVNGNTFENPDGVNVILLRGNTEFTNNIIKRGRTVNVVSGSPVVSDNDFKDVRFKVYNAAEATISNNTINNLEFNDESVVYSTFTANNLSVDAQAVLDAMIVAKIGEVKYCSLQKAIDAAVDGNTITLIKDVTEDVTITQKADLDLIINGDGKKFTGVMTVFGDGRQNGAETLKIQNINFIAKNGAASCIVSPDRTAQNPPKYSYSHNVTVDYCTFTDLDGTVDCAAIRQEDGGDKNLTVTNCTVDATMHSLLQVNNVEGKLTLTGCTVKSKNGINLNSCTNVEMTGCNFDVQGYALRSGVKTGGNLGVAKTYVLENNTLMSACDDGDAVIMFRASSVDANFSMKENVVSGTTHISGNTAATNIAADENYWDGKEAPVVAEGSAPIVVNSYYSDAALTNLVRNEMGSIYAFVSSDRIFGDVTTNAKESIKIEIIGKDGNLIGTSSLENLSYATGFNKQLTWRINLGDDDSDSWAMAWEEGYPSINNMPAKVKLYVDDAAVAEAEIRYTADGDGKSPVFAAKTNAEGKINSFIACTGEYNLNNAANKLVSASADGDNIAILVAGTYDVPTGKNLTITGAVDGVVFDNIGAKNMGGASVTFNKVTFDYYPNVNYTGLQHSGDMVYNNCTFNGQVFLYGESETFNNCTFKQEDSNNYNVWTYGAKEVAFNECTFNSAGKSVLIYKEETPGFVANVSVDECEFNASSAVEGKAAIEMDSSLIGGINLTIDSEETLDEDRTTATGFGSGNVSGYSLWNNKMGASGVNNDITVTVAGVVVLQPVFEAQIGETKYEFLSEAIAAVGDGDVVIKLLKDATLDYNAREAYGKPGTTSLTINGDGKILTLNQKDSDWSSFGLMNAGAKVVFNNMTIEKTGYGDTSGAWNTHTIIFSSNVEMTDVTVNNSMAVQGGATLNNVTINEANGYYGLWINGNGQTVTMNGGSITATNGGRGIKIADQYIDAPASVTLNVTGTTFNTAKKAAVLVSSKAGAAIAASNVNIENVAEDKVNFAWVDEDWAAYYSTVEVIGGNVAQESVDSFPIIVKNDENKVISYFKNLDNLFDNVAAYSQLTTVNVELTGDAVATKVVKTNSLKTYNFTTQDTEGVTMDLQYADNWNYFRKVNIGENIIVKCKYMVFTTDVTIAGTIDAYYPYISGAKVTVTETGVLKYEGGDALQVKGNGAVLTVKGKVIAPTINVWVGNAQLVVSGTNAQIESNWIDIWDGTPSVMVENGAILSTKKIKVSRGGEIVVTDATLNANTSIEVGHNGESAGKLTESGNSTITGEIKMTAKESVVKSDGGLNVTTDISGYMVVFENNEYVVVPIVAKIGETNYASLQDAVDEGGNITIYCDIALAEGLTVAANKTVALDLNGKTVSMVYAEDATANHAMIKNYGNLTINSSVEGGKLSYQYTGSNLGTNYSANTVNSEPGSVLTVKGGTIENLTYDSGIIAYAIDGLTNGNMGDVTVNIEGGTVTSLRQAVRIFANSTTNTGTLNISGGEFTGRVIVQNANAYANKAVLNISGGTFNGNEYKTDVLYVGGSQSATIDIEASVTAGTFNGDITDTNVEKFISGGTFSSDVTEYCADGYICTPNADGTYGIVDDPVNEYIDNKAELIAFCDAVNNGNSYANMTVYLAADIDLAEGQTRGAEESNWTPIGNSTNKFQGTFDGQNHTISNLVINGGSSSDQGFFGMTRDGEIKNVIFENAKVSGRLNVGVVAGTPYTSKYTNIKVTGHVEVNGMSYVGGVGGKNAYANWTDITVNVDNTSYVKAVSTVGDISYRTYVGGVIGFNGEGGHTFKNISSNINVIGDVCDIGGIFGIAHYGNKVENVSCSAIVESTGEAEELGGIAGVWHNQQGQTVTMNDVEFTGTVKDVKGEVEGVDIVGGAYKPNNETADNSGSLIINGQEAWLKVAQIGDAKYLTLAAAAEAVQANETITLLADVTEDVTLPAGITFNGNGKSVSGTITADGNLTFMGVTKVDGFSAGYYNHTINIGEGASLEVTTNRLTVSYGNVFNITGSIENAKTADKSNITPSLILTAGASFNGDGGGVNFNVNNAYVVIGDASTKNSGATGEFNLNFNNSIVDFTKTLKTYEPTESVLNPVVNINMTNNSVVSFASHLELWRSATNFTLDKSNLTVGGSFANAGVVTVKDGANFVVIAPIMSSHGGNTGTIVADGGIFELKDSNQDWENAGTMKVTATGQFITNDFKCVGEGKMIVDAATLENFATATVIDGNGVYNFKDVTTLENANGVTASYDNGDVTITRTYVAKIGDTYYATLAEAVTAAENNATIELIWAEGKAPIEMAASLYGKSVTIKGTATVDWNKGFLFVGRGGAGNATLIFDGANLTSASNSASYGIHVSGREKDTDNKYDGTVKIKNSIIELDYLINKGTMTLDNSTLTVKNGFAVGGRPASETESGEDATATMTLSNNSKVVVNNHNGMGLGYEAIGVMNIDATSTFETTQDFLITAKGTMNNNGGNITINGTLTVNGNLNSSGNITGNITKADAATIILTGGTYTQDVNEWCHADYDAIAMGDGKWIVVQVSGTQTRELPDAGWYWFSTYITYNNEETALDNLQTALGSNASLIKGQNAFTQYLNYNGTNFWTSDLTTLSTAQMYMIKTKADNVTVNLTGSFEDYANTNIGLKQGWNWIGYPINEEMNLNVAIPNATDGDIIKGKGDYLYNEYYENIDLGDGETFTGWVFDDFTMKPGEGYMYKSKDNKSFTYSTGNNNKSRSTLNTVDYNGDNHWFADATQYPNNMNIVAMMSIDGEIVKGNYEVAAFANGECRGSARPIYIEALDAYVLYMTIHGEDVAELTFKYYDVNYGTEYELDNRLTYSSDAIVGSLKDPYIFSMNILGIGENSIDNINIYPNPTTTGKEINLQAVCDKVEVFNALGVKVAEYTNVDSIDAIETAGIYVIRVTIDGNARNCRLVVR